MGKQAVSRLNPPQADENLPTIMTCTHDNWQCIKEFDKSNDKHNICVNMDKADKRLGMV